MDTFYIFLIRRGGMVHMLFYIFIQSWGRGRYILTYSHSVLGVVDISLFITSSFVAWWVYSYIFLSSFGAWWIYVLIYFHPFLGRGGFIQLSGRQPPSQLGGTCPTQCQTLETHIVHNVETLETQYCKQTLLSRQIAKHLTHNNTPLLQTHII